MNEVNAQVAPAALVLSEPEIALLFTEVVMPGIDGRRLADAAKASQPELKVLYTKGYTRNAIVHEGTLDAGVALIVKPFTVDQLARKVRAVLDGR
jgi:DNA-binding NtrC family response regulator